jgi:hypothetical protein
MFCAKCCNPASIWPFFVAAFVSIDRGRATGRAVEQTRLRLVNVRF